MGWCGKLAALYIRTTCSGHQYTKQLQQCLWHLCCNRAYVAAHSAINQLPSCTCNKPAALSEHYKPAAPTAALLCTAAINCHASRGPSPSCYNSTPCVTTRQVSSSFRSSHPHTPYRRCICRRCKRRAHTAACRKARGIRSLPTGTSAVLIQSPCQGAALPGRCSHL
jgi:hypothetical protein